MKAESAHLRESIRDTAAVMWTRGVIAPGMFLRTFTELHGAALDIDDIRFGFDQWLTAEGTRALKRVHKDHQRIINSRQLALPGVVADLDVPSTVQVPRGSVPLWAIEDDDFDAYTLVLQTNINACFVRLTDWLEFIKAVRPVMREQGLRYAGDALRWLADHERDQKDDQTRGEA